MNKELLKVFDNTVLPIEVINEKEFMINVSGITKKYGKNFTDWKNSKGINEYISELEKSNAVKRNLIDTTIIGKTMIHNKLLVPFARFISVKFAVWCDDMIYDILIGNREDEIKRLKEEKKFARLSEDGYTSIIGLVQRTDYSKEQM